MDKLVTNDTLYVSSESDGCFGQNEKIVKIYLDKDSLYACYLWDNYGTVSLLNTKLSESSIKSYQSLEQEWEKWEKLDGFCTTTTRYSLVLKNDSVILVDDECRFNKYDEFLKLTFKELSNNNL